MAFAKKLPCFYYFMSVAFGSNIEKEYRELKYLIQMSVI